MKIYELKHDSENYRWLTLADKSDASFITDKRIESGWFTSRAVPITQEWKPLLIATISDDPSDSKKTLPDIHFSYFPILSAKAVELLGDVLKPNGEILPLVCDSGDYFAYNCLTTVDCLSEDLSQLTRFKSSGRVMEILKYEFDVERVGTHDIFMIPQLLTNIFVTESFVHSASGLHGFEFELRYDSDST